MSSVSTRGCKLNADFCSISTLMNLYLIWGRDLNITTTTYFNYSECCLFVYLDACSRSGVRGADENRVGDLHAVSVVELGGPLADGQCRKRMPLLGVFLSFASPVARAVPIGRRGTGGGTRRAGAQRGWLRAWTRNISWRRFVYLH